MSDLEERLRDAIDASVADAEPKFDVMAAVRLRHRWRLLRATAASAVMVAAAVAAAVLLAAPRIGPGGSAPPAASKTAKPAVPVFPGGGRLLFADRHGLKWLYPDGKTVRIARGFSDAQVAAGRLVAWDKTGAYVMNLDGSRRHLVLPFRPGKRNGVIGVDGLSRDGSLLSYDVGTDPVVTGDTLWVADLATGRRVELGRFSSAMWRDNTTILATSADGNSLLLINAETGRRSVYLTPLNDRLLIRAYDGPRSWKAYAGSIHSDRLAQPVPYGMDGATFSPAGNVMALRDGAQMTFLPTPRPACQATRECLDFPPKYLKVEGALLA